MAALVIDNGAERHAYDLTGDETVIGRGSDCSIQLHSRLVSGRHARVLRVGEQYYLEDLGSRNGTKVNGRRIAERVLLKQDDRIEFAHKVTARLDLGHAARACAATIAVDESTTLGELRQSDELGRLSVQTEAKLKAVLQITHGLAGTIDLKSLLPKILDTLFRIFPGADRGCILLQDEQTGDMICRAIKQHGQEADGEYRLSRTVMRKVLEERTGILLEDVESDGQFDACASFAGQSIRSMMCVPMPGLNGVPVGIMSIDSQSHSFQFKQEDLDLLMIVAGQVGLSYENARLLESHLEEQKKILGLERQSGELRQYFSPKVVEALALADFETILKPKVVDVTVLFCDIRGFSLRGEHMSHQLQALLERCSQALELMTSQILDYGGCVSDFQGDAALGYWGWPVPPPDGPVGACKAALAIHAEFAKARQCKGHALADFHVGIGIAHGPAIAGKIGSKIQPKIGVFGPVVNLASRLEGMTKELRVPILIDETTSNYLSHAPSFPGRRRRLARVRPYGMDTPLTVHQLLPSLAEFPAITDEHIETYEAAVDAFAEGTWEHALHLLDTLPVGDRARDFLQIAIGIHNYTPPRNWDGIYDMARK